MHCASISTSSVNFDTVFSGCENDNDSKGICNDTVFFYLPSCYLLLWLHTFLT